MERTDGIVRRVEAQADRSRCNGRARVAVREAALLVARAGVGFIVIGAWTAP
jgi:hypothetical protein